MKNRSKVYFKPRANEPFLASSIKYGLAVVPYCENQKAWLLPDGPRQQQRAVRAFGEAMRFAKLMNGMLAGVSMKNSLTGVAK